MRTRCPVHELDERDNRADEDAAKQARTQHAEQGGHGNHEVRPAGPPKMLKGGDLEEPGHGHEDDGGKHGLRQGAEKRRQEQDYQ